MSVQIEITGPSRWLAVTVAMSRTVNKAASYN